MSDVIIISNNEAAILVKNYKGGQFFTVSFIKRTNGLLRTMNCRKGVKKDVKGEEHRYNLENKNLICVRDVQNHKYRMISLENIREGMERLEHYLTCRTK